MTECWRDGDLRAFLDGELSSAERQRVTAHLAECHECEARYDEIAGRAALVSRMMDSLAEMGPAARIHRPKPVRSWGRWAVAGAALAAGLAIGAMLIPKPPPEPVAQVPRSTEVEPVAPAAPVPPAISAAAIEPVTRSPVARSVAARAPRRKQLPRDVYLALDDEPFETGFVVRMTLGQDEIPADVVFGKDGRARAVRLIGTQKTH